MTWVKLDDQFPIHRKVSALSDAAFRLHVEAFCWSARNLTDGLIERDELRGVTRIGKPERYAAELVRWGDWHGHGHDCATCAQPAEGGWVIHDYLEYQQSRSKVLQTREQRQAAGKVGGKRSGESRRAGKTAGHRGSGSKAEAKPKHGASRSLEPPAPFLLKKEGTGSAPASRGGARSPQSPHGTADPDNPDWRTMPAYGVPRDPRDAQRARQAAAAARAAIPARRRSEPEGPSALERLSQLADDLTCPTEPPEETP